MDDLDDADLELDLVDLTGVSLDQLRERDDKHLRHSIHRIIQDSEHQGHSAVVAGYSPPTITWPHLPLKVDGAEDGRTSSDDIEDPSTGESADGPT